MGFYDSTRDKDDTTVGVGHSRRYCNTGYDQSQGRRPSTLKCIGPISKGDIEPNHPSEINPNSDSRSRSDGRSRRFVQYRGRPVSRTETKITSRSFFFYLFELKDGGCWGFTTVPVTKTIRLSEWVTPGDTAIPGMTSLKDGDLQHSSALAQSPKEI